MQTTSDGISDDTKIITEFELGKLIATDGIRSTISPAEATRFLSRHASNDWGELSDDDKQANDEAILEGGRILSKYQAKSGDYLYIITEADRSYTTILLTEEY